MYFDVTNTSVSKEGSIRREGVLALHFLPLIISTDDIRSGYTHTPSLNSPLVHTGGDTGETGINPGGVREMGSGRKRRRRDRERGREEMRALSVKAYTASIASFYQSIIHKSFSSQTLGKQEWVGR